MLFHSVANLLQPSRAQSQTACSVPATVHTYPSARELELKKPFLPGIMFSASLVNAAAVTLSKFDIILNL